MACSELSRSKCRSGRSRKNSRRLPSPAAALQTSWSRIVAKRPDARLRNGLGSAAVLDSSAILAVLFDEPGSDAVVPLLGGALVSAVNLAEVHGSLLRRRAKADFAWNRVVELGCEVCPFD